MTKNQLNRIHNSLQTHKVVQKYYVRSQNYYKECKTILMVLKEIPHISLSNNYMVQEVTEVGLNITDDEGLVLNLVILTNYERCTLVGNTGTSFPYKIKDKQYLINILNYLYTE